MFLSPAPNGVQYFDLVVFYDRATGIHFPLDGMREIFEREAGLTKIVDPDATKGVFKPSKEKSCKPLPRDPVGAFDMIESVLRSERENADGVRMHTAVIIDYAQTIFPVGPMASMLDKDRDCLVKLLNWARDPEFSTASNPIILIADSAAQLNEAITASASRIESLEILLPSPEERKAFVDFLDSSERERQRDEKKPVLGLTLEKGFTIQQFAHLSAGLKKANLEDIKLTAAKRGLPISPELVKLRKAEIFKIEYQSQLEVVDPEYGFEAVGGMQWLKDYLRLDVVEPMISGDVARCPVGLLLVGAPGCQPAGERVLMTDGCWKNVEDVAVGDWVISPQQDGRVRNVRVESVCKYDDQQTYVVRTLGRRQVRSYRCSWNHILPFRAIEYDSGSHATRRKHSILKEETVEAISTHSRDKRRKYRLFTSPAVQFPERDLPVHPYVLGVLLGDAQITLRKQGGRGAVFPAVLTNTSRDLVRATKKYGATWGRGRGPGVCAVGEFSRMVKALECFGTDSHGKFVPLAWKVGSIEQRRQLLAGLIDTDGTHEEFSSASEHLADDFAEIVRSIGGTATVKGRWTSCTGKKFYSYRVHYSLGETDLPLVRRWKRQRRRKFEWKNHRNFGFEVIPAGKESVYGFHLENGSQWYVTNDWVVTHNTGKA